MTFEVSRRSSSFLAKRLACLTCFASKFFSLISTSLRNPDEDFQLFLTSSNLFRSHLILNPKFSTSWMSPSQLSSSASLKSEPREVSIVEIIFNKLVTHATNTVSFDLMTFFVAICPYLSKIFLYKIAYSFGILKLSINSNSSTLPRPETLVDPTQGAQISLGLQQVHQQTQNLPRIHPTLLACYPRCFRIHLTLLACYPCCLRIRLI
ncbi:hypothetical protein MKW92_052174 [Papaver armeniacum]|nr:hypothetical protein MKW92_052174 [Papaver armeniacum]